MVPLSTTQGISLKFFLPLKRRIDIHYLITSNTKPPVKLLTGGFADSILFLKLLSFHIPSERYPVIIAVR